MWPVPFGIPGGDYSSGSLRTFHSMAKLESNIQGWDPCFHASGNGFPAKLVVLDVEGVFEFRRRKLFDVRADILHPLTGW